MYEDYGVVLRDAKDYFDKEFRENFELVVHRYDKVATFTSESYSFNIMASFIQAIKKEDFMVTIQDRINAVINKASIAKGVTYTLTTNCPGNTPLIEYCCKTSEAK